MKLMQVNIKENLINLRVTHKIATIAGTRMGCQGDQKELAGKRLESEE